eukprot:GHVQ01002978.1.p1 GENE.GHVQ01002978.1~~GHVQ01002978.1.p1  ORF type:complete len:167 (+),score=17.47 GHVQ01002978.1:405-905(+)
MKICVWLLVCVVVSGGCGLGQCTDEPCLESCVVHLGDKCCCGGGRDFSRCLRSDGTIAAALVGSGALITVVIALFFMCRKDPNLPMCEQVVLTLLGVTVLPILLFVFALSHRVCSNRASPDAVLANKAKKLQGRVGDVESEAMLASVYGASQSDHENDTAVSSSCV